LQIINANNSRDFKSTSIEWTFERPQARGTVKLITNEAMKTYLKDGKVTVRAKVSVKMPDDLASTVALFS